MIQRSETRIDDERSDEHPQITQMTQVRCSGQVNSRIQALSCKMKGARTGAGALSEMGRRSHVGSRTKNRGLTGLNDWPPFDRVRNTCTIVRSMRTKRANSGEVLFGAARRKILALLFGHSDQAYHLRQVVRETRLSPGGVHRELGQLTEAGIVTRSREGRQVYFRANSASPIFAELKSLLTKTVGVADVLRGALLPLRNRCRVAFIYGSFARGEERRSSDVDVLVVGDVSFAEVSDALGPPERTLSREVNPVVYGEAEFRSKTAENRMFVNTVLREPKVFLLGDEDELKRVADEPLAD